MDPKYVDIGEPEDKVIEELSEVTKECADLTKEICKARRFGYFNSHPAEADRLNIERVTQAIRTCEAAFRRLRTEMDDCVLAFERLEVKLRAMDSGGE